jgi:stearoyl-CoA desaturase (delta-9 desaturase)
MPKTLQYILFNITLTALGIVSVFLIEEKLFIFLMWLLIAFGNGTAGHRYFAHNQFSVSRPVHWILAFWTTISAYSSTAYWQVQHRHHHRHTDTVRDIHSPKNGFLQAFYFWSLNKTRIESIFKDRASVINFAKASKDTAINFTTNNFIFINLIFMGLLYLINLDILYGYLIAYIIEHVRLGTVNTILHLNNFPGNYRNYDTDESSQNNVILGIITLGFGWHNNHHADSSKLILSHKWWELDLEGQLGKLISKDIRHGRRNFK